MTTDDEKIKALKIHKKFVDCLENENNAWLLGSAIPRAANTLSCGHIIATTAASKQLGEAVKVSSEQLGEAAKVSSEAAKASSIILGVAAVSGAAVVGGSAVAAAYIISRR
ncbi:hypothetical protein ACA910_011109 [Epithemia clementina (nom. ined.)]